MGPRFYESQLKTFDLESIFGAEQLAEHLKMPVVLTETHVPWGQTERASVTVHPNGKLEANTSEAVARLSRLDRVVTLAAGSSAPAHRDTFSGFKR
jgi:hypothetical protein